MYKVDCEMMMFSVVVSRIYARARASLKRASKAADLIRTGSISTHDESGFFKHNETGFYQNFLRAYCFIYRTPFAF